MPEAQIKLLSGPPGNPDGPGSVRVVNAPSWEAGLAAAAKAIRALIPQVGMKMDVETLALCEKWEQRPDEVKKPFAFFACGGFAIQVRIIPEGS